MQEGITINEAAKLWVREMNAVPTNMVRDCVREHEWKLEELTPITKGDNVQFWDGVTINGQGLDGYGMIVEVLEEKYKVKDSETEWLLLVDKG